MGWFDDNHWMGEAYDGGLGYMAAHMDLQVPDGLSDMDDDCYPRSYYYGREGGSGRGLDAGVVSKKGRPQPPVGQKGKQKRKRDDAEARGSAVNVTNPAKGANDPGASNALWCKGESSCKNAASKKCTFQCCARCCKKELGRVSADAGATHCPISSHSRNDAKKRKKQ